MKKSLFWIGWAILVFFLSLSLAQAGTYTVQRGDTLGEIAKNYGTTSANLKKMNSGKIRNVHQIKEGWVIKVTDVQDKPADSRKEKERTPEGYWPWQKAGANPYLRGQEWKDPQKFESKVDNFLQISEWEIDIPKEAQEKLKSDIMKDFAQGFSQVENEDNINNGDKFDVMMERNGYHTNVVVDLPPEQVPLKSKIFRVESGEAIYCSELPLFLQNNDPACGNFTLKKEVTVAKPSPEAPSKVVEIVQSLGDQCLPELEFNAQYSAYVHNPGSSKHQETGDNVYAEVMGWKNFRTDCSSEYWWGIGAMASTFDYEENSGRSEGDGGLTAGQAGIKRIWRTSRRLDRQWILKGRFGWQEMEWRDPKTNDFMEQWGPMLGFYGEYDHEIIRKKLDWITQIEGWWGINQSVHSSFPTSPSSQTSQTFFSALTGFDYHFGPNEDPERWTFRVQGGFNYQGYDGRIPGVGLAELQYKIPNGYGLLAAGASVHIYPDIAPTFLAHIRYESGDLVRKIYKKHLQNQVVRVGTGVGDNSLQKAEIKKSAPIKVALVIGDASDEAQNSFNVDHNNSQSSISDGTIPNGQQLYQGVRPTNDA